MKYSITRDDYIVSQNAEHSLLEPIFWSVIETFFEVITMKPIAGGRSPKENITKNVLADTTSPEYKSACHNMF